MLISHARRIQWRGKPADLRVVRNDGYCWGLLVDGEAAWDVSTRRDLYDYCDTDALDAFERASRNPRCVEPAIKAWWPELMTPAEVEEAEVEEA